MEDKIGSVKRQMAEVVDHVKLEFGAIRTGRANVSLVDMIGVPYYGNTLPLKQMASISVPEPTVILIQPWDKQAIGDIEQALRLSELGLSPVNEGTQIRLVLPPLTTERRAGLVKLAHRQAEGGKVALRTVRKDVWDLIQKEAKASEITEDDRYRFEEELNRIIDDFNKQIDALVEAKTAEIEAI